jgi:hypothetical protein
MDVRKLQLEMRREGEKRGKARRGEEPERKRVCGVNPDLGLVRATGSRFPLRFLPSHWPIAGRAEAFS